MRKRLIITFIFMGITSILLLGLGVMFFSQLNARDNSLEKLRNQLSYTSSLLEVPRNGPGARPDRRFRDQLIYADLLSINKDNLILKPLSPNSNLSIDPINEDQFETLTTEGFVELNTEHVRESGVEIENRVAGLEIVDFEDDNLALESENLVLVLYGSYTTDQISSSVLSWFFVSSLVVLGLNILVASFLAKWFSKPVIEIEKATDKISGGDLNVRVAPKGPVELQNLATSLNSMVSDLKKSKNLDRQFLLSVSHDLRTPLTVIKGYAEGLTETAFDNTEEVGKTILVHSDRLERLVADILDLARLDANQFKFHNSNFELGANVSTVVDGLNQSANSMGIKLLTKSIIKVNVFADHQRVAQIISNLVENAIKFSKSKVQVSMFIENEIVSVCVEDDGVGIASDEVNKIFDRFYVSRSNPEKGRKSIGMGLTIASEFAQAMGGDLRVESTVGVGTKMIFSLPKAQV